MGMATDGGDGGAGDGGGGEEGGLIGAIGLYSAQSKTVAICINDNDMAGDDAAAYSAPEAACDGVGLEEICVERSKPPHKFQEILMAEMRAMDDDSDGGVDTIDSEEAGDGGGKDSCFSCAATVFELAPSLNSKPGEITTDSNVEGAGLALEEETKESSCSQDVGEEIGKEKSFFKVLSGILLGNVDLLCSLPRVGLEKVLNLNVLKPLLFLHCNGIRLRVAFMTSSVRYNHSKKRFERPESPKSPKPDSFVDEEQEDMVFFCNRCCTYAHGITNFALHYAREHEYVFNWERFECLKCDNYFPTITEKDNHFCYRGLRVKMSSFLSRTIKCHWCSSWHDGLKEVCAHYGDQHGHIQARMFCYNCGNFFPRHELMHHSCDRFYARCFLNDRACDGSSRRYEVSPMGEILDTIDIKCIWCTWFGNSFGALCMHYGSAHEEKWHLCYRCLNFTLKEELYAHPCSRRILNYDRNDDVGGPEQFNDDDDNDGEEHGSDDDGGPAQ